MPRYRPGPFLPITPERINRLPKWARAYFHHVDTFVGAEEVKEIFSLRDQNSALVLLCYKLLSPLRMMTKPGMV